MQINLTNVNWDQLQGLKNNFESMIFTETEDVSKFDVSFDVNTEIDAWKLFFSGADYALAKLGKTNIK